MPMNSSKILTNTSEGLIYHVFPLGLLGTEQVNEQPPKPGFTIREFVAWIPHLHSMGVKAVLFGPLLHSESHGYDTIDLYTIDPRLGSNADFTWVCKELHRNGIAVIMDAVFNHVGRKFFAFEDLLRHRDNSPYRGWFHGVDFASNNGNNDGFSYSSWDGHEALVKLNLENREVQNYIFSALKIWIREFHIDGLRLDAADVISPEFWPLLREETSRNYEGNDQNFNGERFWLMGEMVFGDYSSVCSNTMLDSVTNYELYKGLHSSHNDHNYFELSHSLNRQFGDEGIYKHLKLYNFSDNHDVDRISTTLSNPAHLYPLHIVLFTVPGIPSLYYGSETGISGSKGADDWDLRPQLTVEKLHSIAVHPDLLDCIRQLSNIRSISRALKNGDYRELQVANNTLAFARIHENTLAIIAVNSSSTEIQIPINITELAWPADTIFRDLLNPEYTITLGELGIQGLSTSPCWGRILHTD